VSTILMVDDLAIGPERIAARLWMAGYETRCAADGHSALK